MAGSARPRPTSPADRRAAPDRPTARTAATKPLTDRKEDRTTYPRTESLPTAGLPEGSPAAVFLLGFPLRRLRTAGLICGRRGAGSPGTGWLTAAREAAGIPGDGPTATQRREGVISAGTASGPSQRHTVPARAAGTGTLGSVRRVRGPAPSDGPAARRRARRRLAAAGPVLGTAGRPVRDRRLLPSRGGAARRGRDDISVDAGGHRAQGRDRKPRRSQITGGRVRRTDIKPGVPEAGTPSSRSPRCHDPALRRAYSRNMPPARPVRGRP